MILGGIMRAEPDTLKAAVTAVQYYQDAIAQGLITPNDIGDGGKTAA